MDVTLEGLCIGSNALSSGLAWGPSELLAYAAGCLVALWDPKVRPWKSGTLDTT